MPVCPKCGHSWPFPSQEQRVHWQTGYNKAGEPTVHCGQHLRGTVEVSKDPKKFTCWKCKRAYLGKIAREAGRGSRRGDSARSGRR